MFDGKPDKNNGRPEGFGRHEIHSAAESLPRQVGPYLLLERIGEGGMGMVYRARQSHPEREVAIKMLRSINGAGKETRRFAREIAILARLQHPGIAQIFDAGTDFSEGSSRPYLAMELIHGRSLCEIVSDHEFELHDRLRLVVQVCEAVEYAHNQGVIHRDLKPENILIEDTPEGPRARILDFGVARLADGGPLTVTTTTTGHGHVIGTLGFMSPEMLDGRIDASVDVYALGVLLYELITRELPIKTSGRAVAEVLSDIREGSPARPSQLNPAAAGDLDTIVMTAIDKDLKRRYASPARLADDLQRYLENRPILAREPSLLYIMGKFARRRRGVVIAATVAVLALIAGGLMGWYGLYQANQSMDRLVDNSAFMAEKLLKSLDAIAGTGPVRAETLDRLERQVEDLLDRRPNDARLLGILADTLQYRGNMIRDEGRLSEALPLRLRALEARENLARRFPEDAEIQGKLSIDLVLVGDLYQDQPDRSWSREYYERALTIQERIVERHPDRLDWVDDLGWSYHRLANLALVTVRFAECQALLDRQFGICRRMATTAPDDRRTLSAFQAAHALSSAWHQRMGDGASRRDELFKSLEFSRKMARREPDRTMYLEQFVASGLTCARESVIGGELELAQQLIDELTPVFESLAKREPNKPLVQEFSLQRMIILHDLDRAKSNDESADQRAVAILDHVRSLLRGEAGERYFEWMYIHALGMAESVADRRGDRELAAALQLERRSRVREIGRRPEATPDQILALASDMLDTDDAGSTVRDAAAELGRRAIAGETVGEPEFLLRAGQLLARCEALSEAGECFRRALAVFPEGVPRRRELEDESNRIFLDLVRANPGIRAGQ